MLMMVADSIILKFGIIAYLYNSTDILQKFTKISGTRHEDPKIESSLVDYRMWNISTL
jgi:hypothetical protein